MGAHEPSDRAGTRADKDARAAARAEKAAATAAARAEKAAAAAAAKAEKAAATARARAAKAAAAAAAKAAREAAKADKAARPKAKPPTAAARLAALEATVAELAARVATLEDGRVPDATSNGAGTRVSDDAIRAAVLEAVGVLDARHRYGGLVPIADVRAELRRAGVGADDAAVTAALEALERAWKIDLSIAQSPTQVTDRAAGIERPGRGLLYYVARR